MRHTTEIRETFGAGASFYRAACRSCDWTGQEWFGNSFHARREADEHKADPDAPANTWSLMGRLA